MAVAVPNLNLQIVQDQKAVSSVTSTQETNGQEFENVFSQVKERTSSENKSKKTEPQTKQEEEKTTKEVDVKNDDEKVKEASSNVLLQVPDTSLIVPQYENTDLGMDTAINAAITEAENIKNNVSNQLQNDITTLLQEVKPEALNVSTEVDNSFKMANEQFEEVAQDLTKNLQEAITTKETTETSSIEDLNIEEIKVTNVADKPDIGKPTEEPKLDKQDMFEQLEIETQTEQDTTSNSNTQHEENNNTPNENKSEMSEIETLKGRDNDIIYTKVTESLDVQPASKTVSTNTQIETDVVKQIDEGLQDLSLKNPKVNIVLRPENLGRVKIELQNGNEGLVAKFAVSSSEVKEIFDKNLESLKNTLSSQGVSVDNIVVKLEASANADNNYLNFQNDQFRQHEFANPHKQNAYKQEMDSNKNQLEYKNKENETENEETILINDNSVIESGRIDYRV